MALVYCTKCGRRVSTKAPKCPGCGTAVYQSRESSPQQSELSRSRLERSSALPGPPHYHGPRYYHGPRSKRLFAAGATLWIFTIGVILTIGVVVFVLLPYWAGYQTKKDFTQTVHALTKQGLNITLDSYQRGWFTSKATADVSLGRKTYRLVMHIHQGPFPWSSGRFSLVPVAGVINTRVKLPPDVRHSLNKIFGNASAQIQTVVTFAGNLDTHVVVSPFEQFVGYKRDSVLGSSELEADYNFSPSSGRERTSVTIGTVNLWRPAGHFELKGLTVKGQGRLYKSRIWLGHSHLLIRSINYTSAAPIGSSANASISNIAMANAITLRHGMIDFVSRMALDRSRIAGSPFGPATMSFKLNGIDPTPIIRFDENNQRLFSSGLTKSDKQQAIEKTAALGFALAKHSPKFSFDLSVAAPEGQTLGDIRMGISPGFASDPLAKSTSANYSAVAHRLLNRYLFGSGSFTVPISIMDRVNAKQRQILISRGIVVQRNNDYVCKFNYRQGQLSVNGHHQAP